MSSDQLYFIGTPQRPDGIFPGILVRDLDQEVVESPTVTITTTGNGSEGIQYYPDVWVSDNTLEVPPEMYEQNVDTDFMAEPIQDDLVFEAVCQNPNWIPERRDIARQRMWNQEKKPGEQCELFFVLDGM